MVQNLCGDGSAHGGAGPIVPGGRRRAKGGELGRSHQAAPDAPTTRCDESHVALGLGARIFRPRGGFATGPAGAHHQAAFGAHLGERKGHPTAHGGCLLELAAHYDEVGGLAPQTSALGEAGIGAGPSQRWPFDSAFCREP